MSVSQFALQRDTNNLIWRLGKAIGGKKIIPLVYDITALMSQCDSVFLNTYQANINQFDLAMRSINNPVVTMIADRLVDHILERAHSIAND